MIELGEIDELLLLAGVGFKDEILDGGDFGVADKLGKEAVIVGETILDASVFGVECQLGLEGESLGVEPVPIRIDIGEICDNEIKSAMLFWVDRGEEVGIEEIDTAFVNFVIESSGVEGGVRDIDAYNRGLWKF